MAWLASEAGGDSAHAGTAVGQRGDDDADRAIRALCELKPGGDNTKLDLVIY